MNEKKQLDFNLKVISKLFILLLLAGKVIMADFQKVLSITKLKDTEYFTLTDAQASKLENKLIELGRFDTLLLNAPTSIDVSNYNTFPIMEISQYDQARTWHVHPGRNLVVFAHNLSTRRLIVKTAKEKDFELRSYPPKDQYSGPVPEDLDETTFITGVKIIDIKQSLDMPWEPAEYQITLVCFDWVSNTAKVILHNNGKQPIHNFNLPQPTDLKVDALLSKSDIEKPEITFSIPEKSDFETKNLSIQGKFKIPVTASDVLEIGKGKAVYIPIWFVMLERNIDYGSGLTSKFYVNSEILNQDPEKLVAEGIFKFSLRDIKPNLEKISTYPNKFACYMVINGDVFGPKVIQIEDK